MSDFNEKQRERRHARQQAGFCTECDNPPVPGHTLCIKHKEARSKMYENKKKRGFCTHCKKPPVEGNAYCAEHLMKAKEIGKLIREKKKQLGLCAECNEPAIQGMSLCVYHQKAHKLKLEKKKELGICHDCNDPVVEGFTRCEKHLTIEEGYRQEVAKERIAKKLCLACGKNLDSDKMHCLLCLTRTTWHGMFHRCKYRENYAGRGIKVCERWHKFENFLEDMGVKPNNMTLDRINNDGDYEKDNCRWTDNFVQQNNKTTNTKITFNGETSNMSEMCEKYNIERSTFCYRFYKLGWSVEKTLTTPVKFKAMSFHGSKVL